MNSGTRAEVPRVCGTSADRGLDAENALDYFGKVEVPVTRNVPD